MKPITPQKGQALVELSLLLPVLILLLVGIMQFGLIMHQLLFVQEAALVGGRAASLGAGDGEVVNKIISAASPIDPQKICVKIVPSGHRRAGETVTVTVKIPVDPRLPLVGRYVPSYLEGRVAMRMETGS